MFKREDCPTIMDGWVVRYRLTSGMYSGEINASRNGVSIAGTWPIMNVPRNLTEIVTTLHKAALQARHLAGRGDPKPLAETELPHLIGGTLVYQGE